MTNDLDIVDCKLLDIISQNGRITIVDLAEKAGLSKTACHNRLKRLEDEHYILGYYAQLNSKKLKRDYIAFVEVKLTDNREATVRQFGEAVRKIQSVELCYMTASQFDYILMVRTSSMEDYRKVLGEQICAIPCVRSTSTHPVMQAIKETPS